MLRILRIMEPPMAITAMASIRMMKNMLINIVVSIYSYGKGMTNVMPEGSIACVMHAFVS